MYFTSRRLEWTGHIWKRNNEETQVFGQFCVCSLKREFSPVPFVLISIESQFTLHF